MNRIKILSALQTGINMTSASPNKIWIVKDVPLFAEGTNDNYFEFMKDDINENYKTMEGKPIVTNLTGIDNTDHATQSSLDTCGHIYQVRLKEGEDNKLIVYGNLEVTNPLVGEKLERRDTRGNPELNGVSMGVFSESHCSICGGEMYEDECENGHIRGSTYEGVICTAQSSNSEFEHLALTTMPAEKKSYFKSNQVFLVTATYNKNNKGDKMKKVKEKAQDTNVINTPIQDEGKPELVSDETKKKTQDEIILDLQRQIADQMKEIEEMKMAIEEMKAPVVTEAPTTEVVEGAVLDDKVNTPEEKKMPGKGGIPEETPKTILKDAVVNDNVAQTDGTGDIKPVVKKITKTSVTEMAAKIKAIKETSAQFIGDEEKADEYIENMVNEGQTNKSIQDIEKELSANGIEVTEQFIKERFDYWTTFIKEQATTKETAEIKKLKRENAVMKMRLKIKESGEIKSLQRELARMKIDYSSNDLRSLRVAVKVAKQSVKQRILSRKEKYFGKNNNVIIPKHTLEGANRRSSVEGANKKIVEKGAAFALKEAFEKGKNKRWILWLEYMYQTALV